MSRAHRQIIGGSLISALSAVYFLVLPISIGAASRDFAMGAGALGILASTYLGAFALGGIGAASFALFADKVASRFVAILVVAAGFAASGLAAGHFPSLLASHALTGLGAGALYSISFNLIADSRDEERGFGWKLAAEQAIGTAAFFTFAALNLSFSSIMFTLCAASLIAAPSAQIAAPISHSSRGDVANTSVPSLGILAWLFLTGAFMASLSGPWAFLEPFSRSVAMPLEQFGTLGGVGLVFGGLGGLAAALGGARLAGTLPFWMSAGVLVAITIAILFGGDLGFAGALVAVPFIWNFALAFMFAETAKLDHENRFAGWLSPTIAIGATTGPVIAGALLESGTSLPASFAVMIFGATLSVLVSAVRVR